MESLPLEKPSPSVVAGVVRASLGPVVEKHFGDECFDELFDLLRQKFEESFSIVDPEETNISLFVLLKRRAF
ncbi:hypothetical protein FNV43_RR19977 [Rhamnella rubrinervis]|uniref:SAM dependent carboxyl methyltransferase n=1 Tax=Rhamnella rubrinervis TaxID=2594499 RepID=A0A8K0E085_9ROSA|nr:hypothetical protein FNV43_RR19977 [Rhamnella rubrinervis]